jgi:hypothetical protein
MGTLEAQYDMALLQTGVSPSLSEGGALPPGWPIPEEVGQGVRGGGTGHPAPPFQ